MAAKILTQYKKQIESFELQPSGGGCFELTVNGDLVYSKLDTGAFPDENSIVAEIGKHR